MYEPLASGLVEAAPRIEFVPCLMISSYTRVLGRGYITQHPIRDACSGFIRVGETVVALLRAAKSLSSRYPCKVFVSLLKTLVKALRERHSITSFDSRLLALSEVFTHYPVSKRCTA